VDVRPAGVVVRGMAFLVDELIRWVIIMLAMIFSGVLGDFGFGLGLVVAFLCYWLYPVIFELANNGQTPGKKSFGLQVVHDDGTPIRLPASLLRNLLLAVDFLPVAYFLGIVTMTLSSRFRRVGDLAAGTMVVYCDRIAPNVTAEVEGVRLPPVPLTPEEQVLFLEFQERQLKISAERGEELAEILSSVIGSRGEQAVREVLRIANGVRGGM